jgi:hypothetical protein
MKTMHIFSKDGKHFLVGKSNELGSVLLKNATKNETTVDWTLDGMADEAACLIGEKYACVDCGFSGCEPEFKNGACPTCLNKKIVKE